MRSSRPSPSRLLLLIASFNLLVRPISSMQVTLIHAIRKRANQCVYEKFERGDFATFEIFILDSEESPAAGVQIEGPVIGPEVGVVQNGERRWDTAAKPDAHSRTKDANGKTKMGAVMLDWIERWPSFVSKNGRRTKEMGILHHSFHIDYTHSGEREDDVAARADLSRERKEKMDFVWQRNMERDRRRRNGDEDDDDDDDYGDDNKIHQIVPDSFDPYTMTRPIKSPGWYRMCVHADNQIQVEMDIRSSADVGGINPATGHVYTHDEREQLDENNELFGRMAEANLVAEEVEKALENQVKDDDLDSTRKLMTEVKGVVTKMMMRQQEAHHRMKGHEGDAKRNYKRILKSGLIETVLYVLITLFQVYTVHKWLLSTNVLGR